MDAQSYTAQERRAANQVWAAAGAYGFEPLFLARYTDGTTDFYMNTVVGLIHKYYGDALIRSVFDAWDGDLRQTMLDALRLIRRGIPAGAALDMGITNKAFDSYEQGLIRDVIAARIPAKLDAARLFA